MQIVLPKELEGWCYYDIKSFTYKLKVNAPKGIKEKFDKYKEVELERYNIK